MNDMIYRQDAIDALGEEPMVWCNENEYELGERNQWNSDVLAIKAVQSAQPEITLESAIDYLQRTGWMQEHDRILSSAQPEYFDYTDIDEAWEYYAKEQDANLTDNAKQIKDAMWVGYRIGLKSAHPESVRCKDCKWYELPSHKITENCVRWMKSNGILLPIKPNDYCSYAERRTDEH